MAAAKTLPLAQAILALPETLDGCGIMSTLASAVAVPAAPDQLQSQRVRAIYIRRLH